jgi:hypothetical protein
MSLSTSSLLGAGRSGEEGMLKVRVSDSCCQGRRRATVCRGRSQEIEEEEEERECGHHACYD